MNNKVIVLFLYSDIISFDISTDYTTYLVKRAGGEELLNDFRAALVEFILESDFNNFFHSHSDYYNILIKNAEKTLQNKFTYKEILEEFYGELKNSYNLILAPLLKGGGYGPQVIINSEKNVFCVLGAVSVMGSLLSGRLRRLRPLPLPRGARLNSAAFRRRPPPSLLEYAGAKLAVCAARSGDRSSASS